MAENKNRKSFSLLMENNKFVLVLSFVLAVISWMLISAFQTTETEKVFSNVKVQINLEGSMPANNGLDLFGPEDYFADVTVKGKSYVLNDSDFTDSINLTVSLSTVTAPGVYNLPLKATVSGNYSSDVSVTGISKTGISLYFDEKAEKTFDINEEITELDTYSLKEGCVRENPRLSAASVTVSGPALEINKITSIGAVAELGGEIGETVTLEATLVAHGTSENTSFDNVVFGNEEPVYITVPVNYTAVLKPVVSFTGIPKSMREAGVEYSVSPAEVKVNIPSGENDIVAKGELNIGTIDFSEINNENNVFVISTSELGYTFVDGISSITVTVDMSGNEKRWLEVSVSTDGLKLPEGAALASATVESVQVIGPADSVLPIDASEVLAVVQSDGFDFQKGENLVPLKVTLRTLTDSWVRGTYFAVINVE